MAICNGHKSNGEPCKAQAVRGKAHGKCVTHGGATPSGIACVNFKHGRYSKSLPARMLPDYESSRVNKNQLNLSDEVALVESRLIDMLGRVDSGESGEIWKSLLESVHEMQKCEDLANSTDNPKVRAEASFDRQQAIDNIVISCQEGMADYAAWREVKGLLEVRRKMVETEQKRRVQEQEMLSKDEARGFMKAMYMAVKLNVTDTQTLNRIDADFARLLDNGNQAGIVAN